MKQSLRNIFQEVLGHIALLIFWQKIDEEDGSLLS